MNYVAKWPNEKGIIEWTDVENKTWNQLITRQKKSVENRACDEYLDGLHIKKNIIRI